MSELVSLQIKSIKEELNLLRYLEEVHRDWSAVTEDKEICNRHLAIANLLKHLTEENHILLIALQALP